jgi:hypothetical protein
MATPTYRERLQTSPGGAPSLLRTPNVSDGIGAALARAGTQIEQAGAQVEDVRYREFVAATDSNLAKSAAWATEQLRGIDQTPDDQVGTAIDKMREQWTKQRTDILANAKGERARRYAETALTEIDTRLTQRTNTLADAARSRTVVTNLERALSARTAAVRTDPTAYDEALAQSMYAADTSLLSGEARGRMVEYIGAQLSGAAAEGAIERDPGAMVKELTNPESLLPYVRNLSPDVRARLLKSATDMAQDRKLDGVAAGVLSQYQRSFRAGTQAAGAILADESLTPEEQQGAYARVQQGVSQLSDQRRQENVDGLARLERMQAAGDPGSERLAASLYERGALSEAQYAGAVGQAERIRKAQAEAAERNAALTAVLTGGSTLDPKDTGSRQAVDAYFGQQMQGTAPGSPQYIAAAVQMTARTSIAPESAISWARAQMLGGDPQSAAQAADLIVQLDAANPSAAAFTIDERTRTMAAQVGEAVRSGAPPQVALDLARADAARPESERKALRDIYRAERYSQGNSDELRSLLRGQREYDPGFLTVTPETPFALQAEYEAAVERYFPQVGGNIDAARKRAFADVQRKWGRSEVNGKPELLPYAPERMFPGLTPDVVRADIAASTAGLTPDPAALRLVPSSDTARSGGLFWHLGTVDEDGALDILRDERGLPLRYQLPANQTNYEAARSKVAADKVEAARQRRDQIARDVSAGEMQPIWGAR